MIKPPKFHFTALLIFLSPYLFATTYYLDFSNGSNSNDGLSPATAWKDLFKIRAINPDPGDTFLFKRGEQWAGPQMYVTASGTAAQPITYSAYGSTGDALPIISSITTLTSSDNPSSWSEIMPNIWTLSLSTNPGRLFLDGVEYLRGSTLGDVGANDSEGVFGHWFYDADTELLHLYAAQNPTNLYSDIEGSSFFVSVSVFSADYMVFENLDLRGGFGSALGIYGGAEIEVKNCRLGHSANSGILLIDAVVGASSQASSNITIQNNTFNSNFTFFYGLGSERGCGDGIKLFYGVNNCTVSNNTFLNWAHNAIELLANNSSASGVTDNQFFDNNISAPDIPYAHPLGADGFLGLCQNNEFYRNTISACRTASQVNGNDNWVHHNIIKTMRNSPSKNAPTAYAFILGIYESGLVSQNNRFDHNLIIDTDEAGFLIRGYGLPGQVKGHVIRNNIIYETGQAPYNNAYNIGTGIVIYDTSMDGVGGNTYQNNLFYSSSPSADVVFNQDNSTYYSSSQFNAQNGVDGNTIEDNISGNPLFTDFVNSNYLPLDNSPAVNAGTDTGLAEDYSLNPRFIGAAPDIGPYETDVTGPLPIEWGNVWIELLENKHALIKWETLFEERVSYFQVERMSEKEDWNSIGTLAVQGFGHQINRYLYTDKNVKSGISYYRIKQVDLDGHYEYSRVINLEIESKNRYTLTRRGQETLKILSSEIQDWSMIKISIIDYSGKLCCLSKGSSEVFVGNLPAGLYVIRIENGNNMEVLSFYR